MFLHKDNKFALVFFFKLKIPFFSRNSVAAKSKPSIISGKRQNGAISKAYLSISEEMSIATQSETHLYQTDC